MCFVAFANVILWQFYCQGALLNDAGYLAHMMWRGGAGLHVGRVALDDASFYAFHVTPIFTLTWLAGRVLPLSMAQEFALYVGLAHALLTMATFWMLTDVYGMKRGWGLVIAALLALAFGFNGQALAMVKFPHFEILIPAAMMLFLIAWMEERLALAVVFFAICLATREDAGFQLFALLAVLTALDWRRGVRPTPERGTVAFLIAGFIYSLASSLMQRHFFSVTPLLTANYIGDPPFAHLTWHLVAIRLVGYVLFRTYLVLPAACAIIWAILAKNPYILVGYLAFLPWTLLQLISVNDAIGTIPYHYGYPYIVASFWPLVGTLLLARRGGAPANPYPVMLGFAVMIGASFINVGAQANPAHAVLPRDFLQLPDFAKEKALARAISMLHAARPELGRVIAEDAVAALAPDDFTGAETFWPQMPGKFDTVLYFPTGYRGDAARVLATAQSLTRHYGLRGTPLVIATDRTPAQLRSLAPLLIPLSPP